MRRCGPVTPRAGSGFLFMLLTPAEVAKHLRKRKETVLGWIHSGKLPALNMPGPSGKPRYKVRPADLEAFEREQLITVPMLMLPTLPPGVIDFYSGAAS